MQGDRHDKCLQKKNRASGGPISHGRGHCNGPSVALSSPSWLTPWDCKNPALIVLCHATLGKIARSRGKSNEQEIDRSDRRRFGRYRLGTFACLRLRGFCHAEIEKTSELRLIIGTCMPTVYDPEITVIEAKKCVKTPRSLRKRWNANPRTNDRTAFARVHPNRCSTIYISNPS